MGYLVSEKLGTNGGIYEFRENKILCFSKWKTYKIYLVFDKKKYVELLIISKYKNCDF